MDSGYYAACAGLAAQVQGLDIVAHNLANLGTTGYRAQNAVFRSLIAGRDSVANPFNRSVNDFGLLGGTRLDQSSGNLTPTGSPLDLAIAGGGFFVLESGKERLYTRDGAFRRTSDGRLVTMEGDAVIGEQGPITLPNGVVSVAGDGTISVDGAIAARLRIVEFPPAVVLSAFGNTTYQGPAGAELSATSSSIRQGMLESSNVSPVEGVVQLIAVQRNAEMMQRALTLFDNQLNQIAAQDLPKV